MNVDSTCVAYYSGYLTMNLLYFTAFCFMKTENHFNSIELKLQKLAQASLFDHESCIFHYLLFYED
jgi:hypothetical protein